jgi:hypothetical protein
MYAGTMYLVPVDTGGVHIDHHVQQCTTLYHINISGEERIGKQEVIGILALL